MKIFIYVVSLLALSIPSYGQDFSFDNLDQGQVDSLVKDFSGVFTHNSLGPASSLGDVFGMELGLYGGLVKTPNIESLNNSSEGLTGLPVFGLLVGMSFPMGISGEFNYLPSVDMEGASIDFMSLAGKWTLPDEYNPAPFTVAAKLVYTKVSLGFSSVIDSVDTTFSYDNSVIGLQALGSKSFGIIEPYFGLGLLSGKGTLDVTGNSTSVLPFSTSGSASSSPTSLQYLLGAQLNLFFMALGLEYSQAFGASKTAFKLSLTF